ncbi:hypothetical protein GGI17_005851 [Coemansia sp. S146]|nr:hypothetical protein GGI17_005851 [Coemansia sp. S146]
MLENGYDMVSYDSVIAVVDSEANDFSKTKSTVVLRTPTKGHGDNADSNVSEGDTGSYAATSHWPKVQSKATGETTSQAVNKVVQNYGLEIVWQQPLTNNLLNTKLQCDITKF